MALNIVRKVIGSSNRQSVIKALSTRFYSLYEPDYLESGKSKFPLHEDLIIQIKGYHYPILENYQHYVHNIMENMEIEVEDSWALPPQEIQVQKMKPQSSVVDAEYNLRIFERNILITDVPGTIYPILLRFLEASLPEGVSLNVQLHTEEHDEVRYVPDTKLIELKSELDELGGPRKK